MVKATKGIPMFDRRFKRLRLFTVRTRQAFGFDVVSPHGPLFMIGIGALKWRPAFASTGHSGMTCYSVGIGPLWAVYTRKRRSALHCEAV